MKKHTRKVKKHTCNAPSQQWIDLFLAVADLVDGGWCKSDRQYVNEAYNILLFGDGAEIYKKEVKLGSQFLGEMLER